MEKLRKAILIIGMAVSFSAGIAMAEGGNATTQETYDLVLKAHTVVQELGEEAFPAFNDPKGEFVLKDTYVVIIKCPGHTVTHPFVESARGMYMLEKYPWFPAMCEAAKNPRGQWIEMNWPKPGEEKPSRKLTFVLAVDGTPYQLAAGIYSDDGSVDDLNATLK